MSQSAFLAPRRLAATGLACRRGEHEIFGGIDCAAGPGEALLVTGPNGAGKTTLLMCLAGFMPAAGRIIWDGRGTEEAPGTDMHFVGHRNAVRPGLTAGETLAFWARLNGGETASAGDALAAAGLAHAEDLDAAFLSQGQRRRLALARLIVSPRPIWLLDEPTAALDAAGETWVADLIDTHLDRGGLVVAATHLDLKLKQKKRIRTLPLGGSQ